MQSVLSCERLMPGSRYIAWIANRRRRGFGARAIVVLLLLVCAGSIPVTGCANAQAEPTRNPAPRVLILDSYHQGEAWSDNEITGIRQIFAQGAPEAELMIERLDAKRHPKLEHISLFKEMLRENYGHRDHKPNLLMVLDNPALNFLLAARNELFPGIPAVFAGINDFRPELILGQEGITGVAEVQDMAGTVALALSLHPRTEKILAIHDHTTSGLAVKQDMMPVVEQFKGRVQIDFTPDMTMEELRETLRKLPANSVAIILSFVTDTQGKTFSRKESTELITSAGHVPVYAMHETRMGFGIEGGYLLSGEEHGRQAAELALRVLRGENPAGIPVVLSRSRPIFDFRELQRFDISESRLPEGSTVLFKPVSYYQQYLWWIWGTLVFFSLESGLIFYLVVQRKRSRSAEASLRQSEAKFRQLSETITEVFWIGSTDYRRVHYISPAYEALWGRPASELLQDGLVWLESILDEDRESILSTIPNEDFDWRHELRFPDYRIRRPDESIRWISARAHPIRTSEGFVTAVAGIAEDITERKLAEEALRESEAQLRQIIDLVPHMIFVKDWEGRFLLANQAVAKGCHASVSDLAGKRHADFHPNQEELRRMSQDDREVIEKGETKFIQEETYTSALGRLRYLQTTKVPFRTFGDKTRAVLSVAVDITERKRAEESLLRLQTQLTNALEMAHIGHWVYDVANDLFTFNDQFYKIYRTSAQEMGGYTMRSAAYASRFVHPEDMHLVEEEVRKARETSDPCYNRKLEHRILYADGAAGYVSVRFFIVKDALGQTITTYGVNQDITELKRAEEEREILQAQLNQAQKMESVGRLAGGVAHDFNNMLGIILGHAELALDDISPAEQAYSDLQEILRAAQRSADLVRQLLAFARRQTISPTVLDINETVGSMIKMVRRLIGEDIDLLWNPGVDVWPVKIDATQIDQILANLCVNARDAISGVGTVVIETDNVTLDDAYCAWHAGALSGDYVLIGIRDDGCGMEKEVLDKLFEPFFTTKEVGKGTGLGLATVYGIVKQNKGFIDVQSEPGRGTTFRIYLPRADVLAAEELPHPQQDGLLHGTETILLVEDEKAIMELAKAILQRRGYEVLAARNPAEALKLAQDFPGRIHLLITDVVMPGMNGKELADTLGTLKDGFRILFISGYSDDIIAQHGVLAEGIDLLQKPFAVKALAEKVRKVLDA